MRIALAQLDATLGDVEANEARVRETAAAAEREHADLVVFPELYLSGYALREVVTDTTRSAEDIAALAQSPAALVGFHESGHNSAAYVQGGAVVHVQRKVCLVDYPPFGEDELYGPGDELRSFETEQGRFAVLICNDAWHPVLPFVAAQDGAQILLVPSASSTVVPEAEAYWRDLTRMYARLLQCFVVFVNRVGDEPGFTFWGGSHVVDPWGEIVAEARRLEEELLVTELDLARVEERRCELPLFRDARLELLRDELDRLARDERRIPNSLQFANLGGMTDRRPSGS